jgi:signal transduction protein with GAF and PtsI domain
MALSPFTTETLPRGMPKSGIYLFSEEADHLYVGRSNRMHSRIGRHGLASARHNVASFAFLMARRETGHAKATYKTDGSRSALEQDPRFARAFTDAKARIRRMSVRFVEENDQLRQALLEIYVHVVHRTQFNDFDTH